MWLNGNGERQLVANLCRLVDGLTGWLANSNSQPIPSNWGSISQAKTMSHLHIWEAAMDRCSMLFFVPLSFWPTLSTYPETHGPDCLITHSLLRPGPKSIWSICFFLMFLLFFIHVLPWLTLSSSGKPKHSAQVVFHSLTLSLHVLEPAWRVLSHFSHAVSFTAIYSTTKLQMDHQVSISMINSTLIGSTICILPHPWCCNQAMVLWSNSYGKMFLCQSISSIPLSYSSLPFHPIHPLNLHFDTHKTGLTPS